MNQFYVYIYSSFSFPFRSLFSLVIYFIHCINSAYMSIPVFQFIPLLSPPWYPCICSLHLVSISALLTRSSILHFLWVPYLFGNIWYHSFWLISHSVWYSLSPSMTLQMAIQFCSLWLSNWLLDSLCQWRFLYPFLFSNAFLSCFERMTCWILRSIISILFLCMETSTLLYCSFILKKKG